MNEPVKRHPETNDRRVLSFKAVIVMTLNHGVEPTLRDIEAALKRSGLTFVMPAGVEAPIVIALNDRDER